MDRVHRRHVLGLAAGAAVLPLTPRDAVAQAYPARPVRLVTGFPPGGATDVLARLVAQRLSERLGQQFIVDNRPGAGSNIGTEAVVRASADGYTLLLATLSNAVNATLYEKLGFNFISDMAPVAGLTRGFGVLVVHPSVPAASAAELIGLVKANPGKLNIASSGAGSPSHFFWELLRSTASMDMQHVPYRGLGPALTDLLAGRVETMFAFPEAAIEHIRSGRLRPLAITAAKRSVLLPDVPALDEFVPGYEATAWSGICAPANTPDDIVTLLNREIGAWLADGDIQARLAGLGSMPLALSPKDFGTLIASETEKWGRVIRVAGIKAD
jgi:tripartite-type tricarboxylate transporter receptor subunit TctC